MITKEQALRFQSDPELFITKILGAELESYQKEICRAIVENDRTAIKACHNVGKSFIFARIVLWFASCFPYSKVITTAPTFLQVESILWSEIRAAYARSKAPLGGNMLTTKWQLTKEGDWFAMGLSPRKEAGEGTDGSSFQGWHAPHVLVVFDEATGIPKSIWEQAEGILTSANVKFIAIGNPTSRTSEFYNCFKSGSWKKISLSCFDSPNVRANGIVDTKTFQAEIDLMKSLPPDEQLARYKSYKVEKPYLLATKWVVERAVKLGLTHPLVMSRVLGDFPNETENVLIPLGFVEDAQRRREYVIQPSDRKILGVDVARFGVDQTVIHKMHGPKVLERNVLVKCDTSVVTGEVLNMVRNTEGGIDVIVVDGTGIGSGVVDQLNQAKLDELLPHTTEVREVHFGGGVEDEDKPYYVNLKAKMFFLLADDLKNNIELLEDDVYLEELPTIIYRFDGKGRYVIESKDEYKKRTGRQSPDNADSLMLANYGRYNELEAGNVVEDSGYARPIVAGLDSGEQW